ncbi:NUDIX domain-containing protein [Bdellovibrio sp. HCB337]|uniref:NUDIX domain-containing protein n=1 Tax=Bdellovibrio sp. HCB337 TaxID=3394358 RepID=UPI0039A4E55C
MKKLIEKKLKSDLVYKGSFLQVLRDEVELPNGKKGTREYIPHPGAAMIVPVTAEGKLVMLRQFRYPVQKVFIEFPAGKIDEGEEALETAKRELQEETGLIAQNYKLLTTIHPVIGYSNEHIEIYLATGLSQSEAKLDDEEFLDVFEISNHEAMELMQKGEISDVKTMIGLFWYQQVLKAGW